MGGKGMGSAVGCEPPRAPGRPPLRHVTALSVCGRGKTEDALLAVLGGAHTFCPSPSPPPCSRGSPSPRLLPAPTNPGCLNNTPDVVPDNTNQFIFSCWFPSRASCTPRHHLSLALLVTPNRHLSTWPRFPPIRTLFDIVNHHPPCPFVHDPRTIKTMRFVFPSLPRTFPNSSPPRPCLLRRPRLQFEETASDTKNKKGDAPPINRLRWVPWKHSA